MTIKNLLFSLPDELVSTVYEYDTTHRNIFSDPTFEQALQRGYLKLNSVRQRCVNEVTDYIEFFLEGGYWSNEYGYLDTSNTTYTTDLPKYESSDDFYVATYPIKDTIYYKVLPKGATKENCSFLRKPRRFDGYFHHTEFRDEFDVDPESKCVEEVDQIYWDDNSSLAMYF